MQYKRVTLFAGHYGSGKTNIAVNYSKKIRSSTEKVCIADLDIVNPYFRTKDSEDELKKCGIRLICSEFANTNVDAPALPKQMYDIVDDTSSYAVVDVGGDDRGALALGRLTPYILEEDNYDMFFVANCYRPLTRTPEEAASVMREIEQTSGIKFTGIINNSNLGGETSEKDVLDSADYVLELSKISGLPVVMTTVCERLYQPLVDRVENLFSLRLQKNIINNGGKDEKVNL